MWCSRHWNVAALVMVTGLWSTLHPHCDWVGQRSWANTTTRVEVMERISKLGHPSESPYSVAALLFRNCGSLAPTLGRRSRALPQGWQQRTAVNAIFTTYFMSEYQLPLQ